MDSSHSENIAIRRNVKHKLKEVTAGHRPRVCIKHGLTSVNPALLLRMFYSHATRPSGVCVHKSVCNLLQFNVPPSSRLVYCWQCLLRISRRY